MRVLLQHRNGRNNSVRTVWLSVWSTSRLDGTYIGGGDCGGGQCPSMACVASRCRPHLPQIWTLWRGILVLLCGMLARQTCPSRYCPSPICLSNLCAHSASRRRARFTHTHTHFDLHICSAIQFDFSRPDVRVCVVCALLCFMFVWHVDAV